MGKHSMRYDSHTIKAARKLYATGRFSQQHIATKYGVSRGSVNRWVNDEFRIRRNKIGRDLQRKNRGYKQRLTPTYVIRYKNLVKLGTAVDLRRRFVGIQGCSPVSLQLLGTLPFPEADIHDQFDSCRVHGEWFKLTRRLRLFLKEHLIRV